jgi:hypothetical protein
MDIRNIDQKLPQNVYLQYMSYIEQMWNRKSEILDLLSKSKMTVEKLRSLFYIYMKINSEINYETWIQIAKMIDEVTENYLPKHLNSAESAFINTHRLQKLAKSIKWNIINHAFSFIIWWSLAYWEYYSVRDSSDIDMIIEVRDFEDIAHISSQMSELWYCSYTQTLDQDQLIWCDLVKVRFVDDPSKIQKKLHDLELHFVTPKTLDKLIWKISVHEENGDILRLKTALEPQAISSLKWTEYWIDTISGDKVGIYTYPDAIYDQDWFKIVNQHFLWKGNNGEAIISHYFNMFLPWKPIIINPTVSRIEYFLDTYYRKAVAYTDNLWNTTPLGVRKNRIPDPKLIEMQEKLNQYQGT